MALALGVAVFHLSVRTKSMPFLASTGPKMVVEMFLSL